MLMKSRPYPIPYPADPGIDSGPAVGHQQQAVREDIPRIGFPEGVEQKTSQYGNEADDKDNDVQQLIDNHDTRLL